MRRYCNTENQASPLPHHPKVEAEHSSTQAMIQLLLLVNLSIEMVPNLIEAFLIFENIIFMNRM
jgi:hypothetical protein